MSPFRTKKRSVWLITWEYTREDYFEDLGCGKIAAIFDGRVPEQFVKKYLPLLYATERDLRVFEKVNEMWLYSLNRHRDPDWRPPGRDGHKLIFGDHPWLTARQVKDFFVDVVHADFEISYWTEHDTYSGQQVTPGHRVRLETRRRNGKFIERVFYDEDAIPPKRCVVCDPELADGDLD